MGITVHYLLSFGLIFIVQDSRVNGVSVETADRTYSLVSSSADEDFRPDFFSDAIR